MTSTDSQLDTAVPADTAVRAEFQKNYLWRYAALAGICCLLGLWFAYDGFIGYPSKIPMAEAYDEIRELPAEERIEQWEALASQNDWPSRTPDKSAEEIRDDITGQYFWAFLNFVIGLPALVLLLRSRGSWVERTEKGVRTSWGQELSFSAVSRLNKKKWKDKGIARATYDENGATRTFVFDDFKFDREPIGKMLRDLEAMLKPEQIVGGPTELEADERAAQAEDENAVDSATQDSTASQ